MVEIIDGSELEVILQNETRPIVIDFYADWCMPCKFAAPHYERLAQKYPNARFLKINVDYNPQVAGYFRIQGVPTFVIIKDRRIVGKVVGADIPRLENQLLSILKN